jgi:cysteine desulfurase
MTSDLPIYLDHAATTPVAPEVVAAMLPYLGDLFGNPASRSHAYGWDAEKAVKSARTSVAKLIGASPAEIVFTSGATEANNLAIKGIVKASPSRRGHIITTAIEHKAVLDSVRALEREGCSVTIVGVDSEGRVDPDEVEAAIREDTLVCDAGEQRDRHAAARP